MSNEIDVHVIQTTQEVLSKHIKKPQLTEKLLRKPPFRFLHDLITNVIRETGFLKGLYSERELTSENVKDKEEKIAFLNKLIEATKTITGIELIVKPSKIIAGFEPQNTNLLLQAIGTALDKKLDSSKYVNDLKSQKLGKNKENAKESKPKVSKTKEKTSKEGEKQIKTTKTISNQNVSSKHSESKLKKRSSSIDLKGNTNAKPDTKLKPKTQIPTKQRSIDKEDKKNITLDIPSATNLKDEEELTLPIETIKEDVVSPESDVKSSRIRSTELIDDTTSIKPHFSNSEKSLKDQDSVQTDENELVLALSKLDKPDSAQKQSESEIESHRKVDPNVLKQRIPSSRPKSSVRPSSVRPSSARPGAPRLQKSDTILMKDKEIIALGKVDVIDEYSTYDLADEEETVTIEAAPEAELQAAPIDLPTDKGHLVEQILQQINTSDIETTKSNLNVEWEQAGLKNRSTAIKEVDQLKGAIQELTKMVNPLGKLINYLHEDIEAMHSELDMWNNSIRQTMTEITNHKKIRDESNMPLQLKLNEIEDNIFKHQQQIMTTYSNIIRNEERIQDLLVK